MKLGLFFVASSLVMAQAPATTGLLQVKRIYVGPLVGNASAEALRELIIAGINSTKLFTLTDNADRADAVLKGAADDNTFTDTFDTNSNMSSHQGAGKYTSSRSSSYYGGGLSASAGSSESDSHHIRERKHEAYASVRLCSRDGDVLWSTTQESLGAKFRNASSDVAAKIARQLQLDMEHAQAAGVKPAQR